MRILLFAVGLLALASGGLKFRERIMNKIGTSPLALAEIGTGLVACVSSVFISDGVAVQSVIAGLALSAIFAGSYHQSKLTAEFRRKRDLSESHRLRQFVERANPTEPLSSTEKDRNGA